MIAAKEKQSDKKIIAKQALYSAEVEKGHYLCPYPGCEQPVFPKKGEEKIDHFAHYPDQTDIDHDYFEPETERHMEMKQDAKEYFQSFSQVENVEVEAYREGLQPDLVLQFEECEIAVECQHSKISRGKIKRRSQKLGKKVEGVIWILDLENFKHSSIRDWDLTYSDQSEIEWSFEFQKPLNYFLRSITENEEIEKTVQVCVGEEIVINTNVTKFDYGHIQRRSFDSKVVEENQFLKELVDEVDIQ